MQPIVPNDYSQEVLGLIRPFPKSGMAKYRLLIDTGGKLDTLNERNEIVPAKQSFGQPTYITAQTTIFDPFKGDNVTINVSRSQRVQGQGANQFLAPVLEYMTFNRLAELEINSQQLPLYRLAELHPGNRNNVLTGIDAKDSEGRSTTVIPNNGWLFERVEADKTASELANQQRLTDKVRGIIGTNTEEQNRQVAARLPAHLRFNTNVNEDTLYSQLRAAVEKDPESVFRATTDESGKLEAMVNDAIAATVIEFDHVDRTWLRSASRSKLTAVPTGEPKDGLIAWLLDPQGATARSWLKGEMAEVNKGKQKGPKNTEPVPEGMKRGPFGRLVAIDQPNEVAEAE